jgi:hypothetical protein
MGFAQRDGEIHKKAQNDVQCDHVFVLFVYLPVPLRKAHRRSIVRRLLVDMIEDQHG